MAQNLAYYSAVLGEDKAVNITAREVLSAHATDAQACVWSSATRFVEQLQIHFEQNLFFGLVAGC